MATVYHRSKIGIKKKSLSEGPPSVLLKWGGLPDIFFFYRLIKADIKISFYPLKKLYLPFLFSKTTEYCILKHKLSLI
jgi:hypothetical protein